MDFKLYQLQNADAPQKYPYVAIHPGETYILFIAATQVHLLNPAEILFFPEDYLFTGRSVELDLERVRKEIRDYTGQNEFRLLLRFNKEQHCTLTYHSPTNESAKDYDIFIGYPDPRAERLIAVLYPLYTPVREAVFG